MGRLEEDKGIQYLSPLTTWDEMKEIYMQTKLPLDITGQIEQWAIDRGLHTADPSKQMLKLMEEVGELAEGLAKDNPDAVQDAIGDAYVVLTILSMQLGMDIRQCVKMAYDEIKDRTGRMVNGVFVKESDLRCVNIVKSLENPLRIKNGTIVS